MAVSYPADHMKFSIVAMAFVLALVPCAGRAQGADIYSWGVMAGPVFPLKDLGDDHNVGFNAGITFAFGGIGQLFGVRADAMYNQFGAKSGTAGGNAHILGGTIDLVMGVVGDTHRVYLIGGVGGYGIHPDVVGQKNLNDWGVNGGIGMVLPSINGFIEARYHHFYRALPDGTAAVFVPVTVGILF